MAVVSWCCPGGLLVVFSGSPGLSGGLPPGGFMVLSRCVVIVVVVVVVVVVVLYC